MSQGTPKNTREAIANALAELRATSPQGCIDIHAKAIDVILRHLRDRHSQDATIAELQGESPIEFFNRIYPKESKS